MVKYVLTGATGKLGSRVFKELLSHVPASDIVVSLSNPSGPSPAILESGVEIRHGSYTDPASLVSAFSNAENILLISYPSISYNRVALHKSAIDAAKSAGVRHIYYTSLAYPDDSIAAVMQSHLATEAYLKASGVTYTIVRQGIYSEDWPLYLGVIDMGALKRKDSEVSLTIPIGDGRVAWASRDDSGVATARILAAASGYENYTVTLTGSHAISLHEIAAVVSKVLQRDMTPQILSEEVFLQVSKGTLPDETLRGVATTYHALVKGELATLDPLLATLFGKEPKPVEDTVEDMLTGKTEYVQPLL